MDKSSGNLLYDNCLARYIFVPKISHTTIHFPLTGPGRNLGKRIVIFHLTAYISPHADYTTRRKRWTLKLIVSLRSPSWQDLETRMPALEDAAHALSTLQAENERLKNKLSDWHTFRLTSLGSESEQRLMAENAELRAELEQVKRENETPKTCITKLARGGLTWNS